MHFFKQRQQDPLSDLKLKSFRLRYNDDSRYNFILRLEHLLFLVFLILDQTSGWFLVIQQDGNVVELLVQHHHVVAFAAEQALKFSMLRSWSAGYLGLRLLIDILRFDISKRKLVSGVWIVWTRYITFDVVQNVTLSDFLVAFEPRPADFAEQLLLFNLVLKHLFSQKLHTELTNPANAQSLALVALFVVEIRHVTLAAPDHTQFESLRQIFNSCVFVLFSAQDLVTIQVCINLFLPCLVQLRSIIVPFVLERFSLFAKILKSFFAFLVMFFFGVNAFQGLQVDFQSLVSIDKLLNLNESLIALRFTVAGL